VALLTQCVGFNRTLADLEADCRKLTSYGVAARYPDDLFEPNEADGRDLVAAARRLRTRILVLYGTIKWDRPLNSGYVAVHTTPQ